MHHAACFPAIVVTASSPCRGTFSRTRSSPASTSSSKYSICMSCMQRRGTTRRIAAYGQACAQHGYVHVNKYINIHNLHVVHAPSRLCPTKRCLRACLSTQCICTYQQIYKYTSSASCMHGRGTARQTLPSGKLPHACVSCMHRRGTARLTLPEGKLVHTTYI